jgi:hypothetical protein
MLVTLLTVGVVAACSESTGPGSATVNPSVSVAPAPNAMNVSRGDSVSMMTDMPIDTASCRSRFTLHAGDGTGSVVAGRMRFGNGYQRMMFVPDSLLRPGTRYFVHMQDSVMVGSGMGGMGMMGDQNQMMMFTRMPAGAMRMSDGMGWYFTTGS